MVALLQKVIDPCLACCQSAGIRLHLELQVSTCCQPSMANLCINHCCSESWSLLLRVSMLEASAAASITHGSCCRRPDCPQVKVFLNSRSQRSGPPHMPCTHQDGGKNSTQQTTEIESLANRCQVAFDLSRRVSAEAEALQLGCCQWGGSAVGLQASLS